MEPFLVAFWKILVSIKAVRDRTNDPIKDRSGNYIEVR